MSRMKTLKKRIDELTAEQSSLQQEVANTFGMRIAKSKDADFLFDMEKRQMTKFAGYVCRMLPVLKENFDEEEAARKKADAVVANAKKAASQPKPQWNPGYEKTKQAAPSQSQAAKPVQQNPAKPAQPQPSVSAPKKQFRPLTQQEEMDRVMRGMNREQYEEYMRHNQELINKTMQMSRAGK